MLYQNARICDNNHLEQASITAPESPPYVFSNVIDLKNRNKLWKPGSKSFTVEVDLYSNSKMVSFFSLLGGSYAQFSLSNQATITIKANSINLFTGGEPVSVSATIGELGAYLNLADRNNPYGLNYRYWQIIFDDSFNPSDLEFSYMYLGDSVTIHRNVNKGFTYSNVDRTVTAVADSGKVFTLQKPEQTFIRALSHQVMSNDDKNRILDIGRRVGTHTPFLFVLDPDQCRDDYDFSVRPVYFDRAVPAVKNIARDYYSTTYNLREVL